MRYAINVPNFAEYGNPHILVELARDAEDAGWDGFFIWDHLHLFVPPQRVPVTDPWDRAGSHRDGYTPPLPGTDGYTCGTPPALEVGA